MGLLIEECFRGKIERVELMSPPSEYKMAWSNETRRIDDYAHALTIMGRGYLLIWCKGVRPLLRILFHALPAPMRSRIAAVIEPS